MDGTVTMGATDNKSNTSFYLDDDEFGRAHYIDLVSRIKRATSGQATTPYIGVKGDKFINIFSYLIYKQSETCNSDVTPTTERDEAFWRELSIAVLCEAIYNLTSDLRSQILIDKVQKDINMKAGLYLL